MHPSQMSLSRCTHRGYPRHVPSSRVLDSAGNKLGSRSATGLTSTAMAHECPQGLPNSRLGARSHERGLSGVRWMASFLQRDRDGRSQHQRRLPGTEVSGLRLARVVGEALVHPPRGKRVELGLRFATMHWRRRGVRPTVRAERLVYRTGYPAIHDTVRARGSRVLRNRRCALQQSVEDARAPTLGTFSLRRRPCVYGSRDPRVHWKSSIPVRARLVSVGGQET